MKTKSSTFLTVGIAAVLAAPAHALEAPEDTSPPPAGVTEDAQPRSRRQTLLFGKDTPAKPDADAPAAAFLGVVSSEVPDLLMEHLELSENEGILVRSLMPDGPAAKAGIAVNDVILRVAEQPVKSPRDLSDLVASRKPGDKVSVGIIHKGKSSTLEITLGNRPSGIVSTEPQLMDPGDLQGLPPELADRIRDSLQGHLGALDLNSGADPAAAPEAMRKAVEELRQRMQGALAQPPAAQGGIQMQSGATFRMNDAQGSIELKSVGESKEVTLRDKSGNVTWNGPWDTPQDKAAAPEVVRKRVETLNLDNDFKGKGLRLKLTPSAPPAAE